jgi:hypothetical protein
MARALARWTRAGVLPIFTEPQNTQELLEGSMSLVLTGVLVNFAHGGVINEDQARRPKGS